MDIERKYGLKEYFLLISNIIRTKILYPTARIIRFPFYCRGKNYIDWGNSLTTGVGCRIEALRIKGKNKPIIKFGNRVQLNDYVHICALKQIDIGDDVLLASHIYISDNCHGMYKGNGYDSNPGIPPIKRDYYISAVKIGNNVWIGEGAIILPGVTIGNGAIVGAHSVVNKDIPNYCIAIGAPTKIIKRYKFSSRKWERTNPDGSFIEH